MAGARKSVKRRSSETANDGIMTSRTEMACRITARVITRPCASNLFFRASLKRPKRRAMTIAISMKSAMSDVKGAFPKKPVMFRESYLYILIAFFTIAVTKRVFMH